MPINDRVKILFESYVSKLLSKSDFFRRADVVADRQDQFCMQKSSLHNLQKYFDHLQATDAAADVLYSF